MLVYHLRYIYFLPSIVGNSGDIAKRASITELLSDPLQS